MTTTRNTKPIIERIADVIMFRLGLLTAQYSEFSPVYEVVRPTRLADYTPRHLQIVLTQTMPELVEILPGNPPAITWRVLFNIRCHVLPSEKDTTPQDAYVNTMAADVQRVICDTSVELPEYVQTAWHTFRDNALLAEWQTLEAIESENGGVGVVVPLMVEYRVSELDPYVRR